MRHGLSLLISAWKIYKLDFLYRNEKEIRGVVINDYCMPKKSEIVSAVCYRYLRKHNALTVESWNEIIKIVANRVSSYSGPNIIVKSLEILFERKKKRIKLNKFGRVVSCHSCEVQEVRERLIKIINATKARKEREADEKERQMISYRTRFYAAKNDLFEINQSISKLKEVIKNGKEHNSVNSSITCKGS